MCVYLLIIFPLTNRPADIGKSKAVVAAEFINRRILGCNVIPYPQGFIGKGLWEYFSLYYPMF